MADQSIFQYPAVEGRRDIKSGWTDVFIQAMFEEILSSGGELVIRACEDLGRRMTIIEDTPGSNEYRLPGDLPDFQVHGVPEQWPLDQDDLSDVSTASMVDLLKIVRNVGNNDPALPYTVRVLNELGSRQAEEHEIIVTQLAEKLPDEGDTLKNDLHLVNAPEVVGCGVAEAFDITDFRRWISSDAKKTLRRCRRRNGDGKRVSREVHEYNYCKKSEQLPLAVHLCSEKLNTDGDPEGNLVPGNLQGIDMTYGRFVDWNLGRKLIAEIRKVHRVTRNANVKEVLALTNTSESDLRDQLISEIDVVPAMQQLGRLLGY